MIPNDFPGVVTMTQDITTSSQINVSVFGPADHGKSTLVGYLYSKFNTDPEFNFDEQVNIIRKELGDSYKNDRKYAYILDRYNVERYGDIKQQEPGEGTSRYVKNITISINKKEFRFIDSPGHYKWRKVASKGIIQGNYRIFLIAANEIYKDLEIFEKLASSNDNSFPTSLKKYIVPLFIAIKLSLKVNIIAISKSDLIYFDEEKYNKCETVLKKILSKYFYEETKDTHILPISINYSNEQSENIINVSEKTPYYGGKPLIDYLSEFHNIYIDKTTKFIMPVQAIDFKQIGHKLLVTGKITSGIVTVGDEVYLSPVPVGDTYISTTAKVKAIFCDDITVPKKTDDYELKDAKVNDIVNLSLKIEKKIYGIIKQEDTKLPPMIVNSITDKINFGTFICLLPKRTRSINDEDLYFEYRRQIQLIANGKYLSSIYIGRNASEHIETENPQEYLWFQTTKPIAGICNNSGQVEGQNIVIINEFNKSGQTTIKIIAVEHILHIGFPRNITIHIPHCLQSDNNLKKHVRKIITKNRFKNDLLNQFQDIDLKFSYSQYIESEKDIKIISQIAKNYNQNIHCNVLI